MKNIYCDSRDLVNEASVEALFLDRLLNTLKYPDNRVRRKEAIESIVIGKGSKKENYKPDYVLLDSNGSPIIVIDAKAPKEKLQKYHYQVSSYALYLNQKFTDRNPVLYTILTNAFAFIVYPWDSEAPVFFLQFDDFVDGNDKFLELRSHLSFSAFNQVAATKNVFNYFRPSLTDLIRCFNDCHNLIWKKEKISPSDAFFEFCKIVFIKIREDGKIHSIIDGGGKPQLKDFVFSTNWIESQYPVEPNPIDAILFRHIQEDLESQIKKKIKKRIFEKGERLNLKASTTYEVVKSLQNYDLYGIDEDLNGRMFETFLNATVRGKDLGQFFTPRGVVHYMVETAPIFVNPKDPAHSMPMILDGCCGSGGFLIDALAQLIKKINNISHFSDVQKKNFYAAAKNNHIFGIDANPKIARISRLNMYLHGDGGSKVFKADTLDKELIIEAGMPAEEIEETEELKKYFIEQPIKFDIVMTNPPFSMKYKSSDKTEARILSQYKIAHTSAGALSAAEKSNVLFIERYINLLKPDTGELITIIDDTVLNGDNSQRYRDFILSNFVIIQVVSLPFNTFFRADANVKTSLIHLRRKIPAEEQGSIFMAITNNIGHDDHSKDTPDRNNLHIVAKKFYEWREGKKIGELVINNQHPDESLSCPLQVFELAAANINTKRLDAFYYSPELRQLKRRIEDNAKLGKIFMKKGAEFELIPELKRSKEEEYKDKKFKYFEIGDVSLDGTILKIREDYFENLPTRARLQVREGDVIFAKNNSSRGTTVIIPDWFDGGLVTTGFIGIRPKSREEALILWNSLESEVFRKQVYYYAITASQPEIRESIFSEEMFIPWPKTGKDKSAIIQAAQEIENARLALKSSLSTSISNFEKIVSQ